MSKHYNPYLVSESLRLLASVINMDSPRALLTLTHGIKFLVWFKNT